MTTKPTEEERIQVLESLRGAMQAVTEKLQSVETNLTYTAGQLETQSALWKAATERYERLISEANGSVRSIEKQLDEFKKETDRFKQYSSGIDENLKERFQIFAEKFDNQGKSLGLLETSISRIRELDLDRINDKVKELPSLEVIRRELSNSTSPLVSKDDFNKLSQQVSKIEGSVESYFRNNMITLFLALTTIIGTNVISYYNFVSKIDSLKTTSPLQSSPVPTNSSPTSSPKTP